MTKTEQKLILKNIDKLTKQEIAKFCEIQMKSMDKAALLSKLYEKVKGNDILIQKLYNEHKDRFVYDWRQLEELLSCTKTERLRWTNEEKIQVNAYDYFHKAGKTLSVPLYDIPSTHRAAKKVNKWRKEHEEEKKKNTKKGIEKAKKTKSAHKEMQENFKKEFKAILTAWHRIDSYLGATFELAFWTLWVNRWAKEYQVKKSRSRLPRKITEYEAKKKEYYFKKETALQLLTKTPFAKLSFHQPDAPDRIENLEFCNTHYEDWCMQRQFNYMTKWDYFWMEYKAINKCPHCSFTTLEDYYSLYVVHISDPRCKDTEFCFHIPYDIGKEFLPDKDELPLDQAEEQVGMFQFGRPLFDEEKVIYTEKHVLDKYQAAWEKCRLYTEK